MSQEVVYDDINFPKHYNNHESGIESIEITRYLIGDLSNIWKYAMRYQHKGTPKKDLKKLVFYMDDFLTHFYLKENRLDLKFIVPVDVLRKMGVVIEKEPVKEIKKVFEIVYNICYTNNIPSVDYYNNIKNGVNEYLKTFNN